MKINHNHYMGHAKKPLYIYIYRNHSTYIKKVKHELLTAFDVKISR